MPCPRSLKFLLLSRHVTAEHLGLDPVEDDEGPVAPGEAHTDVGGAPEDVGERATAGDVAEPPGDTVIHVSLSSKSNAQVRKEEGNVLSNGLLRANVCQRTLMRVLKRPHLLDPSQPLLQILDLLEHSIACLLARRLLLLLAARPQLILNLLRLGHVVEHARQEGAFLTGDLGGGGVVGDRAVADGPDVLCALDDEVFVHGETAARVLLCWDLGHEVLDDGAQGITRRPHEETVRDLLKLLLAVWSGRLGLNVLVRHLLDHSLGADRDLLLVERALRVVDQLLAEHGEHIGQSLNEGDVEVLRDLWDPLAQVLSEKILQLASEFDTGGATAHDDHVEEALDLVGRLVLESGGFAAIHDAFADHLGVTNLLEEETVLADTRDT